jgi:Undecaprenyl-phosphate glucose phosphotransferase
MLKEKRQLFEAVFMAVDLVVVSIAWVLAYWLRFETGWVAVDKGVPDFMHYLSMTLFIWLIWAFVFKRMGLYKPMRGVSRTYELWTLVNANALAVLLFIAVTYLFREKSVPFSRLVFVYFGVICVVFTALQRSAVRSVLREIRRRGYNLRYLLLVGEGAVAEDIADRIRSQRELGIQLVGCVGKETNGRKGAGGLPVLGTYENVAQIASSRDIDQVIVALCLEDTHLLPEIMSQLSDSLVDVKVVPDLYRFVNLGGYIEEFEGLPVINLQESKLAGFGLYAKRAVDFLLAILLILIFSPLMFLIALAVKLTSRGPVFYVQERVSYDGSPFNIYKFRTMTQDAERSGAGWTKQGDARVTPLGRFLRSTSLDELPQLFNVLTGDMSIVGPRPERPVFIKEFRTQIPRYMLRHKVPAGMTGWAQVHGWRGDTSIDKRIEYDLYYIENWSLLLDFKILLMTLFRGFTNRNAY